MNTNGPSIISSLLCMKSNHYNSIIPFYGKIEMIWMGLIYKNHVFHSREFSLSNKHQMSQNILKEVKDVALWHAMLLGFLLWRRRWHIIKNIGDLCLVSKQWNGDLKCLSLWTILLICLFVYFGHIPTAQFLLLA